MEKTDIMFFFLGVTFFALLFVSAYNKDKERLAFIELCETMGGVAIIGNYGTKTCLKSETLK